MQGYKHGICLPPLLLPPLLFFFLLFSPSHSPFSKTHGAFWPHFLAHGNTGVSRFKVVTEGVLRAQEQTWWQLEKNCPPTGGGLLFTKTVPLRSSAPSKAALSELARASSFSAPQSTNQPTGGQRRCRPPIRGQQKMATFPGFLLKPVLKGLGAKKSLMGPTPSTFLQTTSGFCFS